MIILEVLRPGPLTTVQDMGRSGYAQYGVPPAGAMDAFALDIGNILVGNSRKAAGLEMTLIGMKARFLAPTFIAITGGKSSDMTLNGQNIRNWCSMRVEAGDLLDIGPITEGCRAYLSITGGIQVPEVLGSRSTYLPAGFGGLEGRALRRGDLLSGQPLPSGYKNFSARCLSSAWIPEYPKVSTVRVIPGLHQDLFTQKQIYHFYAESYEVTAQSNRMGYRLQGMSLAATQTGSLVSDAMVTGAIQVPPDGQPIILAADRQTTGGYPIISVVASVDFSRVAQIGMGQKITFQAVSLEEAQALRRERERRLQAMSLLFRERQVDGSPV